MERLSPVLHRFCALRRDLKRMIGPAGASTGLNCSLCQAGTYWTGSGERLSMRIGRGMSMALPGPAIVNGNALWPASARLIDSGT